MLEVNVKAIFFRKRLFNWREKVFIALYSLAAPTTYQVMVMPIFSMVVDRMST
jgi:hypothetical protein